MHASTKIAPSSKLLKMVDYQPDIYAARPYTIGALLRFHVDLHRKLSIRQPCCIFQAQHRKSNSNKMVHVQFNATRARTIPEYRISILAIQLLYLLCADIIFNVLFQLP